MLPTTDTTASTSSSSINSSTTTTAISNTLQPISEPPSSTTTNNNTNTRPANTMTMAEIASQKRNQSRYHAAGSSRKSRRVLGSSHKVNTSRLRRIREIFWDGDSLYNNHHRHHSSKPNHPGQQTHEHVLPQKNKNRKRRRTATPSPPPLPTTTKPSNGGCFNLGPRLQLTKVYDSPHVYTIDNFLTDAEMAHIEEKVVVAERANLFSHSFVDDDHPKHPKHPKHPERPQPSPLSPP